MHSENLGLGSFEEQGILSPAFTHLLGIYAPLAKVF